jgi:hypothetical protein
LDVLYTPSDVVVTDGNDKSSSVAVRGTFLFIIIISSSSTKNNSGTETISVVDTVTPDNTTSHVNGNVTIIVVVDDIVIDNVIKRECHHE